MIAIIGAGLAGLSTGYYLRNRPFRVFEQQETPGGLCRSVSLNGFTFDITGHLLHLRDTAAREFVGGLLPGAFKTITRNAAIYTHGVYLPYPFQANLYGLPKEVVLDCVMGFVEVAARKQAARGRGDFKQWAVQTFGEGIAGHFFIPYNEKLWQMDLSGLASDWVQWSIPRPTMREVIQGALGLRNVGMGYNSTFLYPKSGGICVLPEALSRNVPAISYGKELVGLNLAQKTAVFSDGERVVYDCLVSTIPLPRLAAIIEDLPAQQKRAAARLRFVTVHNINLGINRPGISDYHWIYFPEADFPFYRVGCYSNFSSAMAPPRTSSLYVEISSRPGNSRSEQDLYDQAVAGLYRCRILRESDRIVARNYRAVTHAYVVFDRFRNRALRELHAYLNGHDVYSIGRYGAWDYSSMQDALLQGRQIAEALA